MNRARPLRVVVRPKGSVFVQKFARALAPSFDGNERIEAEATEEGLLIGCIWESDLERAVEIVRANCAGEIEWNAPHIHYEHFGWPQEPILLIEVQTPADYVGNVIGDLCSRRAMMTGQEDMGHATRITAEAPLAELKGYLRSLAALTQGKGSATAQFHDYRTAPRDPGPPDEPVSAALRA